VLKQPDLKAYVGVRLFTLGGVIFLLCGGLFWVSLPTPTSFWRALGVLSVAFILFGVALYYGTLRIQRELQTINHSLEDFDTIEASKEKRHFLTKEFETMNHHLLTLLEEAKKREEIKQRYNTKLKLKNRQRADMLSAIAHEFRNPIASIMGYSQTLVDDPEIPPMLQKKFLEKIYNNGNKIEALLSRLLLWNKFESGETTLHKSRFDLSLLAEEVVRSLHDKYPTRGVILEATSYKVKADRTLLEVVLKNLIENALKYSKEDVVVHISKKKGVRVIDKGVGISPEEIKQVTKKFYRSGTHSWDNSMGLGLSIVKSILTLHRSRLSIESKEGRGSTFSFKL